MNKRAGRIFIVINDHRIICLNTNIKALHKSFSAIEPSVGSYITMFRKFHPEADKDILYFSLELSGKVYDFHQYLDPKKVKKPHPQKVKKPRATETKV